MLGNLGVIVEVPQVQVAHSVHAGEQSRVGRRPHDIINVIRVVFKGVQRLIALPKEEATWKWVSGALMLKYTLCRCYQEHPMRRNSDHAVSLPSTLDIRVRITVTAIDKQQASSHGKTRTLFLTTNENDQTWKTKIKASSVRYLGAPQLDRPVERGGNKQVGKVQGPRRCVTVEPRDGSMVALEHLTDARFAVEQMRLGLVTDSTARFAGSPLLLLTGASSNAVTLTVPR